jgi:hypothetical protein
VLSVTSPAGAFDGTYPVAVAATDGAAGHSASATGSYVVSTPCTPVAPTFSAAPTSQNGVPGTTRSYAVTVFNHDSSTCPNATLAVQGLLPSGWSGAPSASSITLVPGASAGLTLTVTPSAQAAAGAYDLTLRVADNLTPVHTSGAGLTFVVQVPSDTTVPTTPTGLTASVSQKLKQVKLSWKASSDNVAVTGYRVSRHGALVATTTSTTWTDTTWIGGATYAYTVTATDAAGNVSSAATATVTLGGGGKGGR